MWMVSGVSETFDIKRCSVSDTHHLFTPAYAVAAKTSMVSESAHLARHLLPIVQKKMASGSSLGVAAAEAAREEHARMKTEHGLINLKDICSGKPGALGKPKRTRGSLASNSGGSRATDSAVNLTASGAVNVGSAIDVSDDSESQ